MLIVTRKPGAALLIGDHIRIEILGIAGNHVKLGIEAPRDVSVLRSEVLATIQTNAAAIGQISEQMLDLLIPKVSGKLPRT